MSEASFAHLAPKEKGHLILVQMSILQPFQPLSCFFFFFLIELLESISTMQKYTLDNLAENTGVYNELK